MVLKLRVRPKKSERGHLLQVAKMAQNLVESWPDRNEFEMPEEEWLLFRAIEAWVSFRHARKMSSKQLQAKYGAALERTGNAKLAREVLEKINSYRSFRSFKSQVSQVEKIAELDDDVFEKAGKRFLAKDDKCGGPTFWSLVENEKYIKRNNKKKDPEGAALW